MRFEDLNEPGVRDILAESKGDLIVASSRLCIRPAKLQRYIRTIPSLRASWVAMQQVKESDEYDAMSAQQFEDQYEANLAAMRVDALDAIHDLSCVEPENASWADVKLRASVAILEAGSRRMSRNTESAGLLAELNQIYQSSAQRIGTMRATVTLEIDHRQPAIQGTPSDAALLER